MRAQLHVVSRPSHAEEPESDLPTRPIPSSMAKADDASEPRSRRMLLLERTMYRDGFAPFISLFTLRLRGELSEPRLRQALARVQNGHPLMRCGVEEAVDGSRFVLRNRSAPVPLRIVERNRDTDWEDEARREWLMPFGRGSDPLVRLVWLRGRGVHELILAGHHCICDGPSGVTLLRDCFAAYDNPAWERNAYDTLGAIEDLVPQELLRDRGFRYRVRRRSALVRLALLLKARRRTAARPSCAGTMYFRRWQSDPAEARSLIDRCREEDVTVLAAVVVAVLHAFRAVRGAGALQHAYTMVNARRFMPQMDPEALFGMAPGVEIPVRRLPSPGEISVAAFWESARRIREDLTVRIDRLGNQYYEYLAALETLHDLYPRLIANTEAAPAARHVTFSNLGRLDLPQQYRDFRIEHFYSPLVMVSPSPANTVVLSSFGGVMEFAIISDEASLPRAQAIEVQERAMAILRSATARDAEYGSGRNPERCARGTATI